MAAEQYKRLEIPLLRSRDKKDVGTLTLIRTNTWILYDEAGKRLPAPRNQDTLIVSLSRPDGEQIVYTQIPMAELIDEG
jgi:hypothetical protein